MELPSEFPRATPADENTHPAGDQQLWGESYYFDFFAADGSLGGYIRVGRYPNLGVIWYWACLVGPDRNLVTAIDHTVPFPSNPASHELRGTGLWADHTVEEPLQRWSLGLETHAIALDDPADVYGDGFGTPTPFAFDLEWETDGFVFRYPDFFPRYEIPCRVHGEIKVGDETIDFDGFGQRDHSWGERDWWSQGWCWTAFRLDDGARVHAIMTKPTTGFAFGYDAPVGGPVEMVATFDTNEALGAAGIPTSVDMEVNGRMYTVAPIAWSPVLLTAPDGREARFPRAMCRFTAADGATGIGWIEFNQPQMPA